MGAHATFAPSSAARWLYCPFSSIIGATLPNYDSDASIEGTRVHALIEKAVGGIAVDVEDEDTDYAINLMVDFVRKLGNPHSMSAETKLRYTDEVWGTADVFQPHPHVTTIVDYKNGAMDVQADRNKQLLTYAVGSLETYGPAKFYRLVIVQPNSRTAGDQAEVKQYLATLEEVEAHRDAIDHAVARGMGGEAPLPGRHCRYCSAFGNCPATQETLPFLMNAVRFMPQEVPTQAIAQVLRVTRGLDDFRKNLEKEAMKRIAAGATIEGVHVGITATHRKWQDERKAVEELVAAYGMVGVDPVSPKTAESMGAAGKAIAARLAFKPPGNPSLKY